MFRSWSTGHPPNEVTGCSGPDSPRALPGRPATAVQRGFAAAPTGAFRKVGEVYRLGGKATSGIAPIFRGQLPAISAPGVRLSYAGRGANCRGCRGNPGPAGGNMRCLTRLIGSPHLLPRAVAGCADPLFESAGSMLEGEPGTGKGLLSVTPAMPGRRRLTSSH